MATNKKRKDRGKGTGAKERRRRMRQRRDEIRAQRGAGIGGSMLDAYGLLGAAVQFSLLRRKT